MTRALALAALLALTAPGLASADAPPPLVDSGDGSDAGPADTTDDGGCAIGYGAPSSAAVGGFLLLGLALFVRRRA